MCDRNVDEIPCRQTPCVPCVPRQQPETREDVNASLKGRPVLYTGVVWIGVVRRFLIPRSCTACPRPNEAQSPESNAPKAVTHFQDEESAAHEPPLRYHQKRLPVPLVTEQVETDDDPKAALLRRPKDEGDSSTSPLRALVVQVHEASAVAAAQARVVKEDLGAILRDGQETTAEVIETVRSEDGQRFRLAVISASGLLGYLAGLKRGVVTRLVYSATGATAMATICYPEDTKIYNRSGLTTVRRWMVLGLSLIHRGPEKPLGTGDMRKTNNVNLINNEDIIISNSSKQSTMNSFVTENIISNLRQNIESLSQYVEKMMTKLKKSSSATAANESTKDDVLNSESPEVSENKSIPSLESLTRFQRDSIENLSSKNDTGKVEDVTTRSVPHSPALPVPPKINLSRNKLNIISIKTGEDLNKINHLEETSTVKGKRSRDYFYSRVEDEVSSNDEDDDDDNAQQGEDMDLDNTFVIPTGGIEEKLEVRKEHIKKTGHNKSIKTPLNKKLTVYYRNLPEEEKTSREKGYDDAYSNRGK